MLVQKGGIRFPNVQSELVVFSKPVLRSRHDRIAIVALVLTVALVNSGLAAGVADIQWDQSNVATLRTLNKDGVVGLLGDLWSANHPFSVPKPREIGQYTWADLEGNGEYELVATLDVNGRAFYNALMIYSRDPSGEITTQEIRGWMISDLGNVIQDLNGNGQDELIIPTMLVSRTTASTIAWPVVYRLDKGKYVEASRDFPQYYDNEALPQLDKEISATRDKIAAGMANERSLAPLLMIRDKILRMLGRNPNRGT